MLDRWLIAILTLVALVLWFEGYEHAADAGGMHTSEGPRAILGGQGAEGGSFSQTMPGGLRVDGSTGLLVGSLPTANLPGVDALTWELLRTYQYEPGLKNMPEDIRKLDGKKVVMIGFLMTVFEYDDIHEFHLVASHWSCCYGVPAGLDGAVRITLKKGEDGLPNTIKPLRVIGTLRIKEVKESGIVYAIYSIEDAQALIMDY